MLKQYLSADKLSRWSQLLSNAENVVLCGHASPDGDAMGASLAMCHYLQSKGRHPLVVMPNAFPDFLNWMPGNENVVNAMYNPAAVKKMLKSADLLICLDFSGKERLEELSDWLDESWQPRIVIDHHLNPELAADIMISDPDASSTSEIVYCLLEQLGYYDDMSAECAMCIYCGMMTDTGGFTYNSSRPEIYYIISRLLAKGIDKDKIYRCVYNNYSIERLRLMGYILNEKLRYYELYHAACFTLTREEMAVFHFRKGDAEGLVNIPLQIKGARLSISLREDTEKDLIRVSLRSVDDFPCNEMAAEFFNGGGHLNASGGSLSCGMDEALAIVEKALEAFAPLLKDNDC